MSEKPLSESMEAEITITHYRGALFVGLALVYIFIWWNQSDPNLSISLVQAMTFGLAAGVINVIVYTYAIARHESLSLPLFTLTSDAILVTYVIVGMANSPILGLLFMFIVLRLMISPPAVRKAAVVVAVGVVGVIAGYELWREDAVLTWASLSKAWIYVALMMMAFIEGHRLSNREKRRELEKELENKTGELNSIRKRLERISEMDPLTNTYNRRYFNLFIDEAFRQEKPFSVIFLSIDGLKEINEQKGAQVGDALLQSVAEVIALNIREEDTLCRYSGNIFSVVTFRSDEEDISAMKERFINLTKDIKIDEDEELSVNLLIAAATKGDHETVTELLNEVDELLKAEQTQS